MSKPTERPPRRRRQSGDRLAKAAAEDLLALFYGPLSDEAAAHVANFLTQLAARFEESHVSTIRRYHQSITPPRQVVADPRQLDLFPHDPPF